MIPFQITMISKDLFVVRSVPLEELSIGPCGCDSSYYTFSFLGELSVTIPIPYEALTQPNSPTQYPPETTATATATLPETNQIQNSKDGQRELKSEEDAVTPHPLLSKCDSEFLDLVRKSFSHGEKAVSLCEEGVGGTYFIHDPSDLSKRIAIFKPTDEEPGSPNNPKEPLSKPLLPPGGGFKREIAAFLLDRGLAGVPETFLLEGAHHPKFSTDEPKRGSVQKFVENVGDSSSVGSSRFSVCDVHNIGILDIRLYNLDRNEENLLVQKVVESNVPSSQDSMCITPAKDTSSSCCASPMVISPPVSPLGNPQPNPLSTSANRSSRAFSSYTRPCNSQNTPTHTRVNRAISSPTPTASAAYRLIPIDHTYTLPPNFNESVYFEWQYWKQAKESFSSHHLDYIKNLDPSADAKILRELEIEEDAIRIMMLSSWLLKIGAEHGMNLFEIASMMTKTVKEPSFLETMVLSLKKQLLESKTDNLTTEEFIVEFTRYAHSQVPLFKEKMRKK